MRNMHLQKPACECINGKREIKNSVNEEEGHFPGT